MLFRGVILILILCVLAESLRAGGPYVPLERDQWRDRPVDTMATRKENDRLVAGLLATFLGPFGAHRLYLGTNARVAVIYGLTFGGFGVLPLLDLGHLVFRKDLGPYRNNHKVFMWQRREPTPP